MSEATYADLNAAIARTIKEIRDLAAKQDKSDSEIVMQCVLLEQLVRLSEVEHSYLRLIPPVIADAAPAEGLRIH